MKYYFRPIHIIFYAFCLLVVSIPKCFADISQPTSSPTSAVNAAPTSEAIETPMVDNWETRHERANREEKKPIPTAETSQDQGNIKSLPKAKRKESFFIKAGVGTFLNQFFYTNYYNRPTEGTGLEQIDTENYGLGGVIGAVSGGLDFPDGFSLFLSGERMTRDWSLMANAQYALPKWEGVEPYFYAGLGADYFKKTSSGLGAQLGVGLNFPLNPNASVFIETKAEGSIGLWFWGLNSQLDYQWADFYIPVITGVKYNFPFTPNNSNPENAAASSVSPPQPGSGASSQSPSQKWVIEADYGAPLLQGFSVGYLIDSRWETSVGFSLGHVFNTQGPIPAQFNYLRSAPVQINYFRLSVQGRYNLVERKALEGNFFQPYLSFGYDVTSFNQESLFIYDEIGEAWEQDLQLGLGLEYFFLPGLGAGFTVNYIHQLVYTDSSLYGAFYLPYLPGNSPTLSAAFPIDPNFYIQFRF